MAFSLTASLKSLIRRTPNSLLIASFGLSVIAAAWLNVFYRVDFERAEELKRFNRVNDGKARAFEEHTRRVLKTADNALLYLQTEYNKRGKVTGSMVDFMDWANRDPSINQLAVVNSAGDLLLSQVRQKAPVNVSEREHFRAQAQNPNLGFFIAKPVIAKITKTWSMFVTRRLTAPDGSFGGTVGVGLDLRFFSDFYDTLALGNDQSMMLIGLDGIVRSWRFNRQLVVGKDLTGSILFQEAKRAPTGHYEVVSGIDGKTRLSSYRVMPDYPLVVVVADVKDSALASFARRERSYYLITSLFTLFVAGFCLLLIRAEGRTRRQNQHIAEGLSLREKAVEALRESQDLFSTFIDHLPAVAFIKDTRNNILLSNQACKELFGPDLAGGAFLEFPEAAPGGSESAGPDQQTAPRGVSGIREEAVRDLQGRERTFETRRFVVERANKEPLMGVIAVDITGRRHTHKLEAIGTLAGGVAHDFNNILSAIVGFASLLQLRLPEGDANMGYVNNILAASDRATHLTRSLLAFGRKQESNLQEVDLNEVFRSIERLLRRLISEEMEFKSELAGGTLTVLADSGQLGQVLMNLVINARDALGDGGTLVLRTERTSMDGAFLAGHRFGAPGDYGVISVSDTGTGMDRQTMQRIFEPFFTTKEVGKGTGLGLSMVYGIVQQHGGYIDVQSEPGVGTTFLIYLPLVASRSQQASAAAPGAVSGGSETVLLAEDDPQVRSITKEVLEAFGYRVIAVQDGEEAVVAFREHAEHIKLVILDVIMPRRNGKEAYDEIRSMVPGIKVLFTSGYTADVISQKGIAEDSQFFLAKPLAPETLLRKVREILDTTHLLLK